ncbi:hypothetical protein Ahy_B08g089788 [Arachis hypogaea]|uniref:Oxo-4-hydroxy-4-carboxy-5-ureidoimidazoline decarboxylase domain-containing protein n=1 Tax=Arachis hypogaea TaxID=3818 RepID=A0A444XYV6_ARAHY|nr:hypothetical protein Ahy_B08g089788 [Arachis hypogaea]
MKDFSSYCASTTFAKEMAMVLPFSSLEHAISVAREIWFRKMNELYECGSMYEKKFGYVFVTRASGKSSEDILTELKLFSKESSQTVNNGDGNYCLLLFSFESCVRKLHVPFFPLKYYLMTWKLLASSDYTNIFVCGFIFSVLAEYSGEIVNDTLDEAEIDSADNLDDISSTGINMSMQFDLNKVSEEDNKTSNDQQVEDGVHVAKQRFNLNKKPWFGDDLSDPVSREASGFLTEFFWPGQYDVDEKN